MERTKSLLTPCYCVDEVTTQPVSQAVRRKLKIWLPVVPPDAFLRGGITTAVLYVVTCP